MTEQDQSARFSDPVETLSARFVSAIRAACPEVADDKCIDPLISPSRQPKLGDFQCNAAMGLAKRLGKKPRDLAAAIVAQLDAGDLIEPVTDANIAGPGFINVHLKADTIASLLEGLDTDALGVPVPTKPQTVVVDLFGVNLAKQMHVGHLRSTIIGDAMSRLFTRLGHKVVRQNHVGDWGLPIAMVTWKLASEANAGRIDLDKLTLDDLDHYYRLAQRDCSPDRRGLIAVEKFGLGPKAHAEISAQVAGAEEALAAAKETLIKLQSHDPQTVAVWQRIRDVTMDACLDMCKRLHTQITDDDSAGESSYAQELGPLVQDLVDRGIAEESDGALVVRVEGVSEPTIVRKSDGGFLYATTDIAGIRRRVQDLGADRLIYCVDARQSFHFRQVFGAAHKAGYTIRPDMEAPARLEHAAFGTVLGEDNRPFKTRSGENVKLSDLIDSAIERAAVEVATRSPDLNLRQRDHIATVVAVAAIKYADLSNDRAKDYVFSMDRMVAFEGATGPYLLNALVRIKGIFRRGVERGLIAEGEMEALDAVPFNPEHSAEKAIALQLLRYPAALASTADALEPHRLCGYLYELAGAFSRFYEQCPVLNTDDTGARSSRLRLCRLTARVLADGLGTLGIPTLDRM
jgi:arginyl-tRNA synthetase